jgi:hypothetical protein
MSKGSVPVKVNDVVGRYFQTCEGVCQGDPLSPIPFNLAVDALVKLTDRAKVNGQIKGIIPHLVDDGLSILQYVDDTIILLDHGLEQARNLKIMLSAFEQLSGLKINFHKSEMFYYGKANDWHFEYSQIFGCELGAMPFRYLGIPMHHKRLSNSDWKDILDKFQKRLSSWKSKLLYVGGRLMLLNSVLSSLPLFMFSFFDVPKEVLKKIETFRSQFFLAK